METHKSHTAEYESPKLCVVDLPTVLGQQEISGLQTQQQCQWGRKPRKDGTSKYKGVCFNNTNSKKGHRPWRMQIYLNHKQVTSRWFETEKEAALAYDKVALELFGEYARTNQMEFPEDFKE